MILLLKFLIVVIYEFNNTIWNNNEETTVINLENYGPPKQTSILFVTFENDKFKKSEEGKKLLSQKWKDNFPYYSVIYDKSK